MRIVVTNDDGIESAGLRVLASVCVGLGHKVSVLAPSSDMSGAGAAIGRIHRDERVGLRRLPFSVDDTHVDAYALDGPPGLAALIACRGGLGYTPDLIVSGINVGANTGHAVLHSGTVGAALTAASFGVSGIAFSLSVADPMPWLVAEPYVEEALSMAADQAAPTVLNVNIPALPLSASLRGARLDRFGRVRVAIADRGDTWLQMEYRSTGADLDPGSDTALLLAGNATFTAIEGITEIDLGASAPDATPIPIGRLTEVPNSDAPEAPSGRGTG
jgi:5'-nucleotidase